MGVNDGEQQHTETRMRFRLLQLRHGCAPTLSLLVRGDGGQLLQIAKSPCRPQSSEYHRQRRCNGNCAMAALHAPNRRCYKAQQHTHRWAHHRLLLHPTEARRDVRKGARAPERQCNRVGLLVRVAAAIIAFDLYMYTSLTGSAMVRTVALALMFITATIFIFMNYLYFPDADNI